MADHVQLHQGWMRNFKNDNKDGDQVFCFNISGEDIKDDKNTIKYTKIGSIKTKSLGAISNYYVADFEKNLGKNWETKFGEINSYIRKEIKNDKELIVLNISQEDFLKKFMALCISRSPFFQRFFLEKSGLSEWYGIRETIPISIIDTNSKLFENMNLQFLRNNTPTGFVLPSYSYYYLKTGIGTLPIVVLSDRIAIRFFQENNEIPNHDRKSILDINDEDYIKYMNHYALITEIHTNSQYLIAKKKEDLEELLR